MECKKMYVASLYLLLPGHWIPVVYDLFEYVGLVNTNLDILLIRTNGVLLGARGHSENTTV